MLTPEDLKKKTFSKGFRGYETAEVEIKFVKVKVEVKMLRTEFWNTDNASSKFYFEKF